MTRVMLLGVVALTTAACNSSSESPASGDPPVGDTDSMPPGGDGNTPVVCKVEEVEFPIAEHDGEHRPQGSTIVYDQNPPTSGPNYEMWAAYWRYPNSVYPYPLARPHWVHNLRHGAIVLVYRPDAPAEVVNALSEAFDGIPTPGDRGKPDCAHMGIMTPDPELPMTYAVLAWNYRMTSNCTPKVAEVVNFAKRHIFDAPERECYDGDWPLRPPCFCFEDTPYIQWSPEVPEGTAITYDHQPPVSGPYYPKTLRYGRYDAVVPAPYWAGILVKGGMVILYRPDAKPELVQGLKDAYDALPVHWACNATMAAMVQDPTLERPFAMVSFGQYLAADCFRGWEMNMFAMTRRWLVENPTCEDGTYVPVEPETPAAPDEPVIPDEPVTPEEPAGE